MTRSSYNRKLGPRRPGDMDGRQPRYSSRGSSPRGSSPRGDYSGGSRNGRSITPSIESCISGKK